MSEKVKLGELYNISSGGTPSKKNKEYYENGTIKWVKTGDLKEKYLYDVGEYITKEGLDNSSAKIYDADTVLLAMYGATIGATSILKTEACTNQACASFKKIERIIPEYLYYFLKSKKDKFVKDSFGGAQPNISISYLKNIEINLIGKDVQFKIVNELDRIENIIKLKKEQIKKLNELIKSQFVEMFGDPIDNPKNNRIVKLSDIAEYWNGLTYKPTDVSKEGTIVLRSSNIKNSQLDFEDVVRVKCNIKEKQYVKDNDILMCSRNGSARLVGKVAVIKNLKEEMTFGAFMMIIRSKYYPYLFSYFQTDAFRNQIKSGATTTINQITGNMLNKIKLPLPNMEEINRFADWVKQIDKQKFEIENSLKEMQELYESLMEKYFG